MGAIWTMAGLFALGYGGWIAARGILHLRPGIPAGLAAFVLAWSWLSIGTLFLGLIGWLERGPLMAWSVLGLISGWVGRSVSGPEIEPVEEKTPPAEPWDLEATIATGLCLWAMIVLLMPSLLFPVKVVSDGPIYHLYFAARWWKAARIFLIATPFGENAAPYFPAVGDLWLTWLFVNWGGDRLARVGQFPFLLVAMITVYSLSRRLGAGRTPAIVATAWFATIQPFLIFSFEPNVDTIFVAGYLLAVFFSIRYLLRDDGVGSLVLAGLAAGGAWGSKAPGIVFVPPLLLLIAIALVARPGRWATRARDLALILLVPLVLEGYWPVRNALLTGNPLYPIHLRVFGRTWLSGWYGPEAMPTSPYFLPRGDWRSFVDLLLLVFDPRLMPLWIVAIVGSWYFGGRRILLSRAVWACAGLAVMNVALYWLVIPYRTQQRFFLHAGGLAAIPLAMLLSRWKWVCRLAVFLLAVHVLTPQVWPFPANGARPTWDLSPAIPNVTPSTIPFLPDLMILMGLSPRGGPRRSGLEMLMGLGCFAVAATLGWSLRGRKSRLILPASGLVFLALIQGSAISPAIPETIISRYPSFPDYIRGWIDLEIRSGRNGTRIAYAGTNLPYYLMGPDFRNVVRYINVDAHRGWLLHDYHLAADGLGLPSTWGSTRPGWDRARPDYDAWLANLRAEGIQLLVVARANPDEGRLNVADREGFTIERVWADAHPERFALLYADPLFKIYGVRDSR
jgi:hypothetical protein